MKLPYGYVLAGEEIVIHKEKADAVRSIFEYYLAGASLGKIVDMLFVKAYHPQQETLNGPGLLWTNSLRMRNTSPSSVWKYTWMFSLKGIGDAM